MKNYWLSKKIEIVNVHYYPETPEGLFYFDLNTSLGNTFRCRVSDGMFGSGHLNPLYNKGLDDVFLEKEWEIVERFAQEVFYSAGLLKEKTWDD